MLFLSLTCIGTEWQYWLLFYSLPILNGLLRVDYYVHFCTLVCAMSILLSDNITEEMLQKSDILLNLFYEKTAELYGMFPYHLDTT